MNIGIDIRVLARGTRTGVEEYTINLLTHLLVLSSQRVPESIISYRLFYNAFHKVKLTYPWLKLPNVELSDFRIPNRLFFISARYFNQPKIDQLLGGLQVYFNPHFFVAPLSRDCKKIITFHDLSFERFPEFFSWRKRLWQRLLMQTKKEAARADRIIAVSHSTKDDLVNLYGIDPSKIEVVYSGIGDQFQAQVNRAKLDQIKEKYRLPDKFILYFGTIEPRKNLVGLIKAFELLKESNKRLFKNYKLVLAGAKGWLYQNIFQTARESRYNQDITFTGFVDEEDKPSLYNLAELFVYPSFFEGFGFPPLEAMACGIPTIVSNNSSLPEAVGRAGLMIEPNSLDEMAWAMELVLTDDNLRDRLIRGGLAQAKQFSWQECAQKTLDILIK